MSSTGLKCGNHTGTCLGGAGSIITKGLAGDGGKLVVGFFYHQLCVVITGKKRSPTVPEVQFEEQPYEDQDKVDVYFSVRWPWMETAKRMHFTMKRSWSNVVVNRIKQINSFNEQFTVSIGNVKDGFSVKYDQLKEKFKTTWKK